MKTKLCRPVLIENNKGVIGLTSDKEKVVNLRKSHPINPYYKSYELILISLDSEEKIKENDLYYFSKSKSMHKHLGTLPLNPSSYDVDKCFKIIALQEQLSPKYIQQFIEEYNKGEVNDIEIEMEELYFHGSGYYKSEELSQTEREGHILMREFKPKLTNGFVTIVEKSDNFIKFLKERIDKASSTETKAAYTIVLEQYKKKILYTEEEVKTLLHKYDNEIGSFGRDGYYASCFPKELEDWFNNNKKK